jgi:PAS domain S-box-containing protein
MAQTTYSFLDVAALDEVRERFAAGDALAILSGDLEEVIWANGPGAELFGHADVETIFGAAAPLGAAAKRQIAALRGFPAIGRDRTLIVRPATGIFGQALRFMASAVALPDGEKGILLAQPAMEGRQQEAVQRAIGGFAQPGHFVAFVDATGKVEASSPGFERLELSQEALAALAGEASEGHRIAKKRLDGRRGPLPTGLARLTEHRHLLVVIDENGADEDEATRQADEDHEVWHLGSADDGAPDASDAGGDGTRAREQDPGPEAGIVTAAIGGETAEAEEPFIAETATYETPASTEDERKPEQQAQRAERAGPVRFVWRTDAEGRFSQISPDFARAVGEEAADILGRRFQDVADAFGLDPGGDIAGLLARRDTWSGRSVSWPVAGTDRKVPVDLAALPVYDRNRNFEGFRGFGVARAGDAVADPEGIGMALTRLAPIDSTEKANRTEAETRPAASDSDKGAPQGGASEPASEPEATDPFRGEKPAIALTPAPERRRSDKVIRLAEHRPPAQEPERVLSSGERVAFRQIGERLKQDSGGPEAASDTKVAEADGRDRGIDETAGSLPVTHAEPEAEARTPGEERDEEANEAEAIADLRMLDGVTEEEAGEAAASDTADAGTGATEPQAEDTAPQAPVHRRRRARPGMSLLDFAEWDEAEAQANPGAEQAKAATAAAVELEEAAALDQREAAGLNREDAVDPVIEVAAVASDSPEIDPDPAPAETRAPEDDDAALAQTGMEPVGPAADQAPETPRDLHAEDAQQAAADGQPGSSGGNADAGLSILEKLPVPVLVHSGDVLHYANGEFRALTGYGSVEELAEAGGIGALFADPYEDDAGAGDEEPQRKPDRHLRLKTQRGDEFPVEAFLQSVPWEGGKALVLVLSRVKPGSGGQSPLVAELEARVAEMRTIIDTATDGVVLISRDGDIRSISRPAEALFGIDSDEMAGKPFASLFAIESQKSAADYLNGLSDHGVASVLNDGREVIGREAQGRFIPLFMTIGKLPENSGYCAVVRDITQWKRAEEELTQARSTAERASSHKSEFLARVSHEIRTPLNAIIGFSELMLDEKFGPVANDRYRDYLRDINRSGNHVLDLVNDLLDISKIEAGQQEMSYEAVSLNETLAETVAMMQPQANRERVIIRSSFASRLPDVVADLRSVRQIALNVLSNAVRYTQAGGQVIVSTAYEAAGEVVLRVRDTGIGMTPAEIDQALKPFKQINSLKRARGDGTGLGLPLTKAMVEANRAKFSIHSTPGEGTLVEVAFPSTRVLAD